MGADPEDALERELASALIQAAPDAIVAIDADGRIRFVNREVERLFGYTRDQLLGAAIEMLVPDRLREAHPRERARYMAAPRTRPMGAGLDLAARRRDGSEFPVDISLSAIDGAHGTLYAAAIRDVTERKRLEAKFESLLEAAPDAMVAVDRSGTIRLVNRRTEALFGYARTELLGRPIEILVPSRAREIHPSRRDRYMAHPTPRLMGAGLDLAARRKDGTEFPVDISLSSIETEDGLLVTAAIRDITDRKELEARLRNTERERMAARLQQSQRLETVGQLAGGIAHDFNNLLSIILNYARFAQRRLAADDPVRADIEEVQRAAERASSLTRQLLIFSRREVMRPVALNLGAVIADMDRLLRRTLGEHIQFEAHVAPGLDIVRADPSQIEQVVMNLAVNARDAMPRGGALNLTLENVELGTGDAAMRGLDPGSYVQLAVADTGVGMSREVQERVFEPFFTTKPPGQGTGLGLSTVYGIVTQTGGEVRLYSEPGKGSVFRILFPTTTDRPAPASAAPAPVPHRATGEVVLLVEDEESLREMTRRILTEHGYAVVEARNPSVALTTSQRQEQIHLLLTDLVMPQMSGRELAGLMRRLRPGLPVLYMSGYTQEIIDHQGELDAPLLEKPFTEESLLAEVRAAMGHGESAAPP